MKDVLQKPAGEYTPRGRLDPAGFERHVSFQMSPPPEDLVPFVDHLWAIRWDRTNDEPYVSEEVMHRPYVDVFLSKQESGIQGTFRGKRAYVVSGTGRIVGARFRPGAFRAFYHGAISDLLDRNLALQDVFPWADAPYVEGLLVSEDTETWQNLLRLLREKDPLPDPHITLIGAIIAAVESDESLGTVEAAARRFGKSQRWLQQLFREYLGVGLKWLLQRRRLLAAAEQIRVTDTPDWAGMAYELGYSSQQHFITAFKEVVGKTPVQYKNDLAAPP